MSRSQKLQAEIETSLGPGPSKRGNTVLRSVTELFIDRAEDYSDEQVEVFDDVMQCLLGHTERDAKVELSTRLAPIARAPARLVQALMKDKDPAISTPMLQQSRAVSDIDLTTMVKSASPEVLMMVAKRDFINKVVSDQMIARGIPEITHALLANPGAEISETSFVKMIGDCGTDAKLGAMISERQDLPEELRPFLDAYKPKAKTAPRLVKTGR
ncbi:MAG: DUF2336 domain-containing protein [Xanthobacteraceae bacterium]